LTETRKRSLSSDNPENLPSKRQEVEDVAMDDVVKDKELSKVDPAIATGILESLNDYIE
jgi:hypothetical protein